MSTTVSRASYTVVEEPSIEAVVDELAAIHAETRGKAVGTDRFRWLYQANPDGEAVVWTLRSEQSNEIVGFTACLPRRTWISGSERTCWIGSDFSILKRYRSLGLALKLRRAAKEQIDRGRCEFLYAHPNDRMAVIHEQVGHFQVGRMVRLARLLTTRSVLEERVGSKRLAKGLSLFGDSLLAAVGPEWRDRRRNRFAHREAAAFGPEFDDLFEREKESYPIMGVRDSRYLNWRYAHNPLQRTQLLTLSEGGRLLAYLVFAVDERERVAVIQDIFPVHKPELVEPLLAGLTRLGRGAGWRSATFTLLETHPLLPVLTRWQYRRRPETSRMFAYAPDDSDVMATMNRPDAWHITVGDRDV